MVALLWNSVIPSNVHLPYIACVYHLRLYIIYMRIIRVLIGEITCFIVCFRESISRRKNCHLLLWNLIGGNAVKILHNICVLYSRDTVFWSKKKSQALSETSLFPSILKHFVFDLMQ